MTRLFLPLRQLVVGRVVELDARFGHLRHGVSARRRHFRQVLLERYLAGELDALLEGFRQALQPSEVAGVALRILHRLVEGDRGQTVLEAEDVEGTDGGIERIGHALLDRRRRFAPCDRRGIRPEQTIVLLQNLRPWYAELERSEEN